MLLNLVKIRYGDIPVFMDVGQVVAGYSIQRSIGANASFNTFNQGPVQAITRRWKRRRRHLQRQPDHHLPGGGQRFALDHGQHPPQSIMNVLQVADRCRVPAFLRSINGIDNRRVAGGAREQGRNPEFYVLLDQLSRIKFRRHPCG